MSTSFCFSSATPFSHCQPLAVFYHLPSYWSVILPLLILSYYVSLSSSLTDHPSLQMTSTQRHQRNGKRNRENRELEGRGLVLRFQLYSLKEWWWRMIERMTLHHFLTGKTVWQIGCAHTHTYTHTHSHTHAQIQQCWQENSLLPGQSIHLLLPLCLYACTIGYWQTHTSIVLYIVL